MTGTSGGAEGTSGRVASASRIVAVVAAITLVVATVNSLTTLDDYRHAGRPVDAWEPWVWELTSAVFWIAVAVPLVVVSRRLRPPRLGWPATIAAHAALSLPLCALHLAWFAVSRGAIYAALGSHYRFGWEAVYEWRKDLVSVFVFAAIAFVLDRWAAGPSAGAGAASPVEPYRFEVRDGARVRWFAPLDIERVEAAGNYVELQTAAGAVLHRATLSGVEADLAPHGFVRIHRSRLVRAAAVTSVASTPAGDFEAVLASGARVAGSRRFRSMLD